MSSNAYFTLAFDFVLSLLLSMTPFCEPRERLFWEDPLAFVPVMTFPLLVLVPLEFAPPGETWAANAEPEIRAKAMEAVRRAILFMLAFLSLVDASTDASWKRLQYI